MNQDFFSEFDKEEDNSLNANLDNSFGNINSDYTSNFNEGNTLNNSFMDTNNVNINEDISTDFLNDIEKTNVNEIKNTSGISKYRCRDCKNIIITGEKINTCSFCNSSNLDISDYNGELSSTVILDFKKSSDDALKDYKKRVFNPLVPFSFKNKKVYESINKFYIGASLNNVNVSGSVKFIAVDSNNISKDSIKKDKYEVIMTSNFLYKDIIVNGLASIDDDLFRIVSEFNNSDIRKFDSSYLRDNLIILGSLTQDEINNKIEKMVLENSLNMIKGEVKHELKKIDENNLVVKYNMRENILIPFYQIRVKHEGVDYLYLMNGNTGKSHIKLIYSLKCLIGFSIVVFLIIFLVALLVAYFL